MKTPALDYYRERTPSLSDDKCPYELWREACDEANEAADSTRDAEDVAAAITLAASKLLWLAVDLSGNATVKRLELAPPEVCPSCTDEDRADCPCCLGSGYAVPIRKVF